MMNLRGYVTRLIYAVGCAVVSTPGWSADPIYSNQPLFYVPFTAPSETTGNQLVLYVSGDRGQSWHPYQTQPVEAGRFSFHAGADGEFWFAVQENALPNEPPSSPELQVIVDRVAPELEVVLQSDGRGTVTVHWQVVDQALADLPVQLEFRLNRSSPWQPVPPNRIHESAGNRHSGRTEWQLPAASQRLFVRAVAADRAGNQTAIERELSLQEAHQPQPPNTDRDSTWPVEQQTAADRDVDQWQSLSPDRAAKPDGMFSLMEPASSPPPSSALTANRPIVETGPPSGYERTDASASTAPSTVPSTADDGRYRLSGSRRFQLDYVIENTDGGGVHRVEVWYTEDGARTWRHYGDDPDRQSPMVIEVPHDGRFGFRLLVQSREGLVAQPPRSGDEPDMWITVDSEIPLAKLTSARYGRGDQAGLLVISWDAQDEQLAELPVALFFGPSPEGPWRQIASRLADTGSFAWDLDDRVPTEFYLRLEVLDHVGNMAVDVLQNPLRRDGLSPQGMIRGVQPIDFGPPPGR